MLSTPRPQAPRRQAGSAARRSSPARPAVRALRQAAGRTLILALLLPIPAGAQPPPGRTYSAIQAGADNAMADMLYHFWDPAIPRIRPTTGNGAISNAAPRPTFWQMASMANLLYWQWRATGSEDMRARLGSQFAEIRHRYTDAQLSSADSARDAGIINVSDDAAWALQFLMQVHDATGDPAALRLAMALADDTWRFFADPNHGGAGLLYATPRQDPNHQGVSTMFEALLAHSSLDIYRATGIQAYLDRARASWAWMHRYLRHPTGVYFCELDIRPTVGGAPNPHLRTPVGGDRPGDIKRGGSVAYLGGTMAMASLSAALWLQDGAPEYRAEVDSIVAGMLQPATFLRPGDLLVNDRDAWSDGDYAPAFVADVLSLDSADPTGAWHRALAATALSITRQRTPDGFYGPDWSGPEWDPAHRFQTWQAQGATTRGQNDSGAGMAEANQMQTSASSVAMVLAAAMAERGSARR